MNCLLTGSNGFLGRVINHELSKKCVVFGLSKNTGDYKVNLVEQVPDFNHQFDIVVHAAGKAHSSSKKTKHVDDFYKVNVQGTQNLLKGLEKSLILPKSFLFISTVAVYGINEGCYINENTPLLAEDAYGQSKIMAENIVMDWCFKNNIICTIFRLPLVVGSNPPGNLGALVNGIRRGYYFNIAGRNARKSMVLSEDVAKIILISANIGGVYNLTDGYHPTFLEISTHIATQLGKPMPICLPFSLMRFIAQIGDLFGVESLINTPKLNKIISDLTFDDNKARTNIGWVSNCVLSWQLN
jgi:nucleoside-diphosphate-sugar epimerase